MQRLAVLVLVVLLGAGAAFSAGTGEDLSDSKDPVARYYRERSAMVTDQIAARGITDPEVLRAMGAVPRHLFVPDELRPKAYSDTPLPIGYGQTISQPYIVAYMTEKLAIGPGSKVLEIGTGSGYQSAVLAEMGAEVYSIEIVPELAVRASSALRDAGYPTVRTAQGDGYYGWPDVAPFDAIIVTAAAGHVPPPLLKQLKPNGRLIIPLGSPYETQDLLLIRSRDSDYETERLIPVVFVPMTGEVQGQ